MSNSRQQDLESPQLRAVSVGFSSGYNWRLKGSEWGVLTWASQGVISVTVDRGVWVVPPQQALWIPPAAPHGVRMAGRGVLRQVYLASAISRRLASVAKVMTVSPLLAALLRRVCSVGTLDQTIPAQARLLAALLDELVETRLLPIELPMPSDARARAAAERVQADPPLASRDVASLSRSAGASVRTLERLFRAETGLSLGAWLQRARLVHAMTMLAEGATVTQAGLAAGYSGTSAFVAAFRRMSGVTPGRYAKSARRGQPA